MRLTGIGDGQEADYDKKGHILLNAVWWLHYVFKMDGIVTVNEHNVDDRDDLKGDLMECGWIMTILESFSFWFWKAHLFQH